MKIGIDARLYGTGHAGIGRYTQELVKNLEKIDSDSQYVIFLQKSNFDEYQPAVDNFKKVLADFKAYSWQEQILFPGLIGKYGLDLAYFTHFNVPFFYRGKFMVTIHDLIISHYPSSRATTLNPLLYRIKLLLYQLVVHSTAKRAQKIIAISEFTKRDIIKFLHVNPEKIAVSYEGVDLPADGDGNCQKISSELGDNFLLYVGSAYPHKNLEKLIQAFALVVETKPDYQLVLVGKKNYFYNRLIDWMAVNFPQLKNRIIFTGYLLDHDLSCLYKKATLYVFPSLIEGFGLPPLEAQSYSLPVLSSKSTCLPEILGDSAIYFDPDNVKEMAEIIISTIDNQSLRQDLMERGRANLQKYSWRKMAEEIKSLYKM